MLENVKIGDKLWSPINDWGEVDDIDSSMALLEVKFGDSYNYYALDGMKNGRQVLFWDEIDMTPPPKPKREVTVEGWINLYGRRTEAQTDRVFICDSSSLFETKEMADRSAVEHPGRLGKAVHIKHTYTEIDKCT